MPAASAGNVLFSKLVAFKETTPGTIPTLTSGGRKMLVTPTGVISEGTTIELGTERSVALRNPLIGSTGTHVLRGLTCLTYYVCLPLAKYQHPR